VFVKECVYCGIRVWQLLVVRNDTQLISCNGKSERVYRKKEIDKDHTWNSHQRGVVRVMKKE
jgi:hypothetical protein